MSGGAKANKSGEEFEKKVAKIVETAGYRKVEPLDFFFELRSTGGPLYARQCVIGMNAYGNDRKADIILYHSEHWPKCLVIECKWQSSEGSVDDKYPFEVLTIEGNKYPTIAVLGGKKYRPGAKRWFRSQAGLDTRLMHVMEFPEFRKRFPSMRYWYTKSGDAASVGE